MWDELAQPLALRLGLAEAEVLGEGLPLPLGLGSPEKDWLGEGVREWVAVWLPSPLLVE